MTLTRVILAAALAALSAVFTPMVVPAQTTSGDTAQVEFDALQGKLQSFASQFGLTTEIEDVKAALGTKEWSVDQPCANMCSRYFDTDGGAKVPFFAYLEQDSFTFDSSNYHYDRPFKADEAHFELVLDDKAPADICFSQTSWNDALTKAGWEPVKPFTLAEQVDVAVAGTNNRYGFPGKTKSVAVTMAGYVTRRGDTYLALSAANGGEHALGTIFAASDVAKLAAPGSCLRVVDVGGPFEAADTHNRRHAPYEKEAYDAAQGIAVPSAK